MLVFGTSLKRVIVVDKPEKIAVTITSDLTAMGNCLLSKTLITLSVSIFKNLHVTTYKDYGVGLLVAALLSLT